MIGWSVRASGILAAALFLVAAGPVPGRAGEEIPRITKEELKSRLGEERLVVLDVRAGGEEESRRIAGAVYEDPGAVASWAKKYDPGKTYVLYCA